MIDTEMSSRSQLGIYPKSAHKKLEFWHKNNLIHEMDIDSAQVQMVSENDSLYSLPYLGINYSNKKQNVYSVKGGFCQVKIKKNPQNQVVIQHLSDSLEIARSNTMIIDVVIRNSCSNNFLQLNMISSMSKAVAKEEEFDSFKLFYLAIRC
jgi:hypothetical protein